MKTIFCADVQIGRSINGFGQSNFLPLDQLSSKFLHYHCRVDECAINFKRSSTRKEDIVKAFEHHTPRDIIKRVFGLKEQYSLENRSLPAGAIPTESTVHDIAVDTEPKGKRIGVEGSSEKRARLGGIVEIEGRKHLAKLSPRSKLQSIVESQFNLPDQISDLMECNRLFAVCTLDPIVACLVNHFDSNQQSFLDA